MNEATNGGRREHQLTILHWRRDTLRHALGLADTAVPVRVRACYSWALPLASACTTHMCATTATPLILVLTSTLTYAFTLTLAWEWIKEHSR